MTRASFNYKTVSGIGSIVLENCVETKFKRLSLFGNSAQGENPSIESPKEIKNSGKYDEVSGKYVIDVGVTGKNLIDVDELRNENGYLQSNYMKSTKINPFYVEKDKKYLLIAKGKSISNEYSTIYFGGDDLKYTYTNTYVLYSRLREYIFNENKYVKIILTANKTAMITSVMIHGSRLSDNEYEVEKLGLFEMSQVDSVDSIVYEPYHEPQTVRLELEKPLTKWDRIEKRDGVWGVACQTGHMTLTGNDEKDGGKWYEGHNDLYSQYHIEFADNRVYYKRGEYEKYAYCNVFKAGTLIDRDTIDDIIFVTKGVYTAIGICSKRWSNLDGFKKYLQENPLEVIYRTSKEEFVPLPKETQLVLESLYTFDGTTTITVDSGEVETGIEVEYAVKN